MPQWQKRRRTQCPAAEARLRQGGAATVIGNKADFATVAKKNGHI